MLAKNKPEILPSLQNRFKNFNTLASVWRVATV